MPTAYVTAPPEAAADLATLLVKERLAACVNRLPSASTYRWEGAVATDDEEVLLAKTTAERYDDLVERVRAEHPHEVPCIERFDESAVDGPFAAWIAECVR